MALVCIGPVWINPKHVSSVGSSPLGGMIRVKMHDGEVHEVPPQNHPHSGNRMGVQETIHHITKLINEGENP